MNIQTGYLRKIQHGRSAEKHRRTRGNTTLAPLLDYREKQPTGRTTSMSVQVPVSVPSHPVSFIMKTHQGMIRSLLSKKKKSAMPNKKKLPDASSSERNTDAMVRSSRSCSSTAHSDPIICPAPALLHLDEDADYRDNVHHYNTKTWQMYNRITKARRKSLSNLPRFDFPEGAADVTPRKSSRSLSADSYGFFSLDD